jgi:diguanylate cyclase (GGDEF)-like protein/PAS domain S-box-containing protein
MKLANDAAKVPWHRSLRLKLVATAILVEVLMLGLLLANSYRLVSEALESQTRARLEALAPLLNASLAGCVFQRDHSEIDTILEQLASSRLTGITYIAVFDERGELLARAGTMAPHLATDIGIDRSVAAALADLTYDTQIALTLPGETQVGTVSFGLSLSALANLRGNVLQQSLLIAATEVLLSMLLLASGGYWLTRHIAGMLAATRRIASADYSTPIAVAGQDEIGVLAQNFNAMAATVRSRIEALAESESRFRAIFDAAGDAFFIHDANSGRLLDVNRRMCEMYGCTRDQALQSSARDLSADFPPYTQTEAEEKLRLAREVGPQTFDWLARRRDGEKFWVEVNLRHVQIGTAKHLIALVRDISERKRYQEELEFLAHHDPLTQLPNRVLLGDRLLQAIAHARRSQRLLAIAYLDLDGFKPINDSLGHEAGDRLLQLVAQRLKECTRADDTVCRLGGDEFALLLGGLASIDESGQTLQRLLDALAAPYYLDEQAIMISASIGVTIYPFDDADTDTLLRHADQAMYIAKQAGRNRFHLFDAEHDRRSQAYRSAQARVASALAQHEFVMHYQPQVDMPSGAIVGAEALIRWQHPLEGLLAPARFLPLVENSDLAIPLGEWVIETVLTQMSAWRRSGLNLKVGINIAARHLQIPDFSTRLAALLARYPDVPPAAVELEVVESVALEDIVHVARIIEDCHALGVAFALDDFGTGYSSLSYFKRLKVDLLKIDQSFVRDLLDDEEDRAIVAGVIGLTQSFKRRVIAEGVETVATGTALIAMGCPLAQGYGIARPMPAAELPDWMANWRPDPRWTQA